MEPSEKEALRKLPAEEVTFMTYELVHDLKKDIVPRVEHLEKWQTRVIAAGGTVAALFGAGLLNFHSLLTDLGTKLKGR